MRSMGMAVMLFVSCVLASDDIPANEEKAVVATPRDGATIPSAFIALTGSARAGSCLEIRKDGQPQSAVCADISGHFDRVIEVSAGAHTLRIASITLHVVAKPKGNPPGAPASWELMREGDIILSEAADSSQKPLYNPRYTHAAIYIGPDASGAALIAEAVGEELAQGLGDVRAVPIEQSLTWRAETAIDIFRLKDRLSPGEKTALLTFVRGVLSRRPKFWTAADETASLYSVWLGWDAAHDRPANVALFQKTLDRLQVQKFSTDLFNCASLVWRAYFEGTKGRVDFSDPNRIAFGGQLATAFAPAFLDRLRPYFLGPDSFYLSGKLEKISGSR